MSIQSILLIIAIIVFICLIIVFYNFSKKHGINIKKQQLEQNVNLLQSKFDDLVNNYNSKAIEIEAMDYEIDNKQKDLSVIKTLYQQKDNEYNKLTQRINNIKIQTDSLYEQQKQTIEKRLEDFKKITSNAANVYVDNIEKVYQDAEAAHTKKMTSLKQEFNEAAADLQKLQDTRKAAHQALLKQKQIKDNKNNYRLLPSSLELQDIHTLEHLKKNLHKPRVLSMLIWQTYFQPLAKEKFPIILQDKTKMGIYKITNLQTDECYIGQSVDIYKRWSDHCKAGLGIDTPPGNKLYKSMQDIGLQNFTFELLCECSKQELDEKEKYFISLYQADLYGYNGTKGNK